MRQRIDTPHTLQPKDSHTLISPKTHIHYSDRSQRTNLLYCAPGRDGEAGSGSSGEDGGWEGGDGDGGDGGSAEDGASDGWSGGSGVGGSGSGGEATVSFGHNLGHNAPRTADVRHGGVATVVVTTVTATTAAAATVMAVVREIEPFSSCIGVIRALIFPYSKTVMAWRARAPRSRLLALCESVPSSAWPVRAQ